MQDVYSPNTSLSIYLSIYLWLYSLLLVLDLIFRFLILYTVGRTTWMGDQPVVRPICTHRTTQTQNKYTKTTIPSVKLEPTIPAFERMKAVHALDRAAAVIGPILLCEKEIYTSEINDKSRVTTEFIKRPKAFLILSCSPSFLLQLIMHTHISTEHRCRSIFRCVVRY
jgi:hypothetical protein